MNVFLTVDVETYTGDYERDVWANGFGLSYILEQLKQHDQKATFFVEALGGTRWGLDGIKKICDTVQEDRHEVGLHVHPVVADVDGFEDNDDKLYDHDLETQIMLIERGKEILESCGVAQVKSFRAGDFAANGDTLKAMDQCGINVSSNRDLDQKSSIKSQVNNLFAVKNDISSNEGVIDVPLSCFRSPLPFLDGEYRHLQICAVSSGEMESNLQAMKQYGYSCATILTHPQEFFWAGKGEPAPVHKNRRRLSELLDLVCSDGDLCFRTADSLSSAEAATAGRPDVRGRLGSAVARMCEQAIERLK